jgi:(p)ppGpp synthase/HD superfamily hydrolase
MKNISNNTIDTSFLNEKQLKLLEFVKLQHGEQKRKYTNEPYWHHLVNVAKIVSKIKITFAYNITKENFLLIETALCHDLLEDTKCTEKELNAFLNLHYLELESLNIVSNVWELTDQYISENYPLTCRKSRKELESWRLSQTCFNSQTVKYADLIDNSLSICQYDKKFAKTYLMEKKDILSKCKKGNFDLYLECCNVLFNNLKLLKLI